METTSIRRLGFVLTLLAILSASGCRRWRHLRTSRAARPRAIASRIDPGRPVLATHVAQWIAHQPLGDRAFVTAVDGMVAALGPDGTVRVAREEGGTPVVRDVPSPCRFDPTHHNAQWTLPPRVALDGRGFACCAHDGSAEAPSGVYCADLTARVPHWAHLHAPAEPVGVGSGHGAMALFASDLWCTRDGGRSIGTSFRGDDMQTLSVASCDADGRAVAVTGVRSPGGIREQTMRVAMPGGGLELVPRTPRGNPVDARMLDDGTAAVLLATAEGWVIASRAPDGTVRDVLVDAARAMALGAWGRTTLALVSGDTFRLVAADGTLTSTTIAGDGAAFETASRVGRTWVAVAHDGTMARLDP